MAEKQSILGRITQLAKANINALLDRAEDPQKMLDQLIRDYTNSIADAESAVAQTIGNLRLAETGAARPRPPPRRPTSSAPRATPPGQTSGTTWRRSRSASRSSSRARPRSPPP